MKRNYAKSFKSHLFAATLLQGVIPAPERTQKLMPYFDPPPDSTVQVPIGELRDLTGEQSLAAKGSIVVNPPPGFCFHVRRDPEMQDIKVCKQSEISFKATDAGEAGKITWQVFTGPKDEGTMLNWKTPYRVVQYIPAGEHRLKSLSKPYVISGCEYEKNAFSRRVLVKLLGQKNWVVNFPKSDRLLPQPSPQPNLYLHQDEVKVGGIMGNGLRKKDNTVIPQDDTFWATPVQEKHKAQNFWIIQTRNTYYMPASQLVTETDAPEGLNGECRYQYENAPDDPESGWIECHDTSEFEVVYFHIPCSKNVID